MAGGSANHETCSFSLTDGTYEIKSESSLLSTITWKLLRGDPATCSPVIGQYTSQTTATAGVGGSTSSVPVYADANGKLQQLSFGPEGFGTGTCEAASAK